MTDLPPNLRMLIDGSEELLQLSPNGRYSIYVPMLEPGTYS